MREAAYNLIGPVDDAAVLDLFAGSGAMGLEALSRGAAQLRLRRVRPEACAVIKENLEKLRLTGAPSCCKDAFQALREERARRRLRPRARRPAVRQLAKLEPRLGRRCRMRSRRTASLVVETSRGSSRAPLDCHSRRYGSARITLFTR